MVKDSQYFLDPSAPDPDIILVKAVLSLMASQKILIGDPGRREEPKNPPHKTYLTKQKTLYNDLSPSRLEGLLLVGLNYRQKELRSDP